MQGCKSASSQQPREAEPASLLWLYNSAVTWLMISRLIAVSWAQCHPILSLSLTITSAMHSIQDPGLPPPKVNKSIHFDHGEE